MPITFDVPNLDDSSTDANDYRELNTVLLLLAQYCRYKSESISYRNDGCMNAAKNSEYFMDKTYKQLPDWAKW